MVADSKLLYDKMVTSNESTIDSVNKESNDNEFGLEQEQGQHSHIL